MGTVLSVDSLYSLSPSLCLRSHPLLFNVRNIPVSILSTLDMSLGLWEITFWKKRTWIQWALYFPICWLKQICGDQGETLCHWAVGSRAYCSLHPAEISGRCPMLTLYLNFCISLRECQALQLPDTCMWLSETLLLIYVFQMRIGHKWRLVLNCLANNILTKCITVRVTFFFF